MAKITKKQINAIDAMCRNGFRFDRYDFVLLGEKNLSKTIMLVEEKKAVKLNLSWQEETVKRTDEHGVTMTERTGNLVPRLHCSVWHKPSGEGCWHSYGLGKSRTFTGKASPGRLVKQLCRMTELVTDEMVCGMLPEHDRGEFRQKTGLIQAKP